jgi:predicted nucleic acid-binding protein
MTALLDTGVLLAALADNDEWHAACAAALDQEANLLLPDVVLPEVAYLLIRDAGYPPLIELLKSLAAGELPLVRFTSVDLARAAVIMEKYADAGIDLVDCILTAMAERLNITRILTIDRRHFSIIRPAHCPAFEIIP